MASTIIAQTISAATETSILMLNSSWGRLVSFPGGWTTVRFGIRFQFGDLLSNPASTPHFAVGLCSGTSNLIGDATTTHFVGVSTNQASWTRNGVVHVYYQLQIFPLVKVASTLTYGSNIATTANNAAFGKDGDSPGTTRGCMFVEVTKGSPNYTFQVFYPQTAVDVSSATFLQQMALGSPVLSNHTYGTSQTLAVNEGTNGTLNAVSCWWDRSDFNCYINDIAFSVLA